MKKTIAPSLICMDLCNLQSEVENLEMLGINMLHVDIIDGLFSPDMPLGINTVRELKKLTNMVFDTHLMSVNNENFVDMLIDAGVERISFHPEFENRPSILLRKIKDARIKAGLAISPETTINSIEYLLPLCDFVLLMRIDAGYAHLPGQTVYPQTEEKIKKIREFSKKYDIELEIEVDGRVGFSETKALLNAGVDTFVSGTKGIFSSDSTRKENYKKLKQILESYKEI